MKIIHLIESIQLGGAENVACSIVEQCAKICPAQFDFLVAELYPRHNPFALFRKQQLAEKNIRSVCLYRGRKYFGLIFAPFALVRCIRSEKPDVIHAHTDLPDFVLANTLRILRLLRRPVPRIVRTIHSSSLWGTHPVLARVTEKMFSDDAVVAISEAALAAYVDLRMRCRLAPSVSQRIVYNGCAELAPAEHPFQIAHGKLNVCFCGRFEAEKGIDLAMKAIEIINAGNADMFRFHIVGSGTRGRAIKKIAARTPNVYFYGTTAGIMADKFYVFDAVMIPSRVEGLSLVSIEASLSRTPVIITRIPGLSETVPADWPLAFDAGNAASLADVIERISAGEYDVKLLADQAFAHVSRRFSMHDMALSYAEVYKKLMDFEDF